MTAMICANNKERTSIWHERRNFLLWVYRHREFISTSKFLISGLAKRYKAKFLGNHIAFCPLEIASLAKKVRNPDLVRWELAATNGMPAQKATEIPESIPLASGMIPVAQGAINWRQEFQDPEDTESLHRWNWILVLLTAKKHDPIRLAVWVTAQLEAWSASFQSEINQTRLLFLGWDQQKVLRWSSYTVGERIANAVIFYDAVNMRPPQALLGIFQQHAEFLARHLEYRNHETCNHIVNNARALYLAGSALGVPDWKNLAVAIVKRELPNFVSKDGFLREGSSHYQFLFTRWMLELFYYSQRTGDSEFSSYLAEQLPPLIKQCHFFMVYDESSYQWDIPKFGDISPDFTPQWLFSLPWSLPAMQLVDPPRNALPEACKFDWASLFINSCHNSSHQRFSRAHEPVKVYPCSGWFRIDHGGYTLFLRLDRGGAPTNPGHYHNDALHFCLFYRGLPLLVDSGRLNYRADDFLGQHGVSPQAHNSVLIDNLGILPLTWRRFPTRYGCRQSDIQVQRLDSGTVKIIASTEGFQRLSDPVFFKRTFLIKDKEFAWKDEFSGQRKHKLDSYLHWSTQVTLRDSGLYLWRIKTIAGDASFGIEGSSPFSVVFYRNAKPLSLVVNKYGFGEEATTMKVLLRAQFPISLDHHLLFD